jgi:hypothetical protein
MKIEDRPSSTRGVKRMNQSITLSRPAVPMLVLASMSDWSGLTGTGASRSRRIMILIAGIIALSIADLLITIAHLRTVGMIEANPVAAYLIDTYQSVWILAAYKLITVGICITALYVIRKRLIGEMAAWTSVAILAGMAIIWHLYATELEDPVTLELVRNASMDDGWLYLR